MCNSIPCLFLLLLPVRRMYPEPARAGEVGRAGGGVEAACAGEVRGANGAAGGGYWAGVARSRSCAWENRVHHLSINSFRNHPNVFSR